MSREPTPDLRLEHIAARLAAHRATSPLLAGGGRAAVAALLRFDRRRTEVLLMKRRERESDRWSGHVSFPGGQKDAADRDLLATAVREAREEVGLDLSEHARLLGRLDAVRAVARGKVLPMTISPFVFELVEERPLVLNEEAESCFWLPLDDAAGGALDDRFEYRLGPVPLSLACWKWQGYVVWGLTYQMLQALLALLA